MANLSKVTGVLSAATLRQMSTAAVAAVATESARKPSAAVKEEARVTKEERKEISFWMRDPKTGNWMPESHFGDVDAAEMRAKLLPRK